MKHHGRVALVTGGARGIGLAIAQRLRDEGAAVGVLDLNPPPDETLAHVLVDLAEEASVQRACAELTAVLGPADIGIHAAAYQVLSPIAELSTAEWQRTMWVNVDGGFFFARELLPGMRSRGWGRLLFITSSSFVSPPAHMSHYIASKGALVGLTRGLAKEVGVDGVTVNALAPGLTRTEHALDDVPAAHFDFVRSRQCLNRNGEPQDQAAVASFLVSEDAGFMTGQTVMADGGEGFL